jgi:hypothetical protein
VIAADTQSACTEPSELNLASSGQPSPGRNGKTAGRTPIRETVDEDLRDVERVQLMRASCGARAPRSSLCHWIAPSFGALKSKAERFTWCRWLLSRGL